MPGTPCSGSRGPPLRMSRRRRAHSRLAGSRPAGARTPPTRSTRRSAAVRAAARRAGRCRRPGTGSPEPAVQPRGSFEPVQRDQLADEERVEAPRRLPARPEEPLLGADEAHRQPFGRQRSELGQVSCVLLRVCDDEVCAPERDPIGAMQEPGLPRTGAEEAAIFDDGLVERHERVEDHRPAACDSLGGGDVEVAGVAHDQRVAAHAPAAEEEPRLGEGEPARRHRPRATTCAVAPPTRSRAVRRRRPRRREGRRSPAHSAGSRARTSRSRERSELSAGSRPRAARSSGRRRCAPRGGWR